MTKNKRLFGWMIVIAIIAYNGYMFIRPSVTIINHSSLNLERSIVTLPSNRLDFGSLTSGQKNEIYYSLSQADGRLSYAFTLSDGNEIVGSCGYITNNEFSRRTSLLIDQNLQVACDITH